MFHNVCAGASPNLNANTYSYANANPYAYTDANGYSYPNTNEHSDQYFDTAPTHTSTLASRAIAPALAALPCATDGAVLSPQDDPGLVEDCTALLQVRDTLAGRATLNWRADQPSLRLGRHHYQRLATPRDRAGPFRASADGHYPALS